MCVEREREREIERELHPFLDLPTPKYFCQYSELPVSVFSDIWLDYLVCLFCLVSFLADAPPINQNKKMSKDNFSVIYLLRRVSELTFSIIQKHYKSDTLWHLDASILFTSAKVLSAKVVLDKRPQKNFLKSNAPCVLLLFTPTCHFLNGWCLVGACFLGFLHSSSSLSVPCIHLLLIASFQTRCIWRGLTSVKLRLQSRCSLV